MKKKKSSKIKIVIIEKGEESDSKKNQPADWAISSADKKIINKIDDHVTLKRAEKIVDDVYKDNSGNEPEGR